MHPEINQFVEAVKQKYPVYFRGKKVLEVGSLDINGSIRGSFHQCIYTGIDLGEGPGVDKVVSIHEHLDPKGYDVVISTEMLEHDVHWQDSLVSMYANLKSGGLMILTCAGPNRHEHGTKRTTPGDSPFTTDYYRNISEGDFHSVLPEYFFSEYSLGLYRGDTDLYFYGIKK